MEKDWTIVFSTTQDFKANLVLTLLKENNINAVKINEKDTTFGTFGDIEVYVNKDDLEKALQIIKTTSSE
ncbi:MAG: DUF2007 domain-containing protein [Marinifilaceae bacterium]|jgi:type III secretory pathway lipoprotein EscJ|nr:DUF2007 domain-containing protein [Marinilabiliaceae bacterium JC040]MCT4601091.1 DUF2007 domain-containing protein [Marinifilaceae bacterium]